VAEPSFRRSLYHAGKTGGPQPGSLASKSRQDEGAAASVRGGSSVCLSPDRDAGRCLEKPTRRSRFCVFLSAGAVTALAKVGTACGGSYARRLTSSPQALAHSCWWSRCRITPGCAASYSACVIITVRWQFASPHSQIRASRRPASPPPNWRRRSALNTWRSSALVVSLSTGSPVEISAHPRPDPTLRPGLRQRAENRDGRRSAPSTAAGKGVRLHGVPAPSPLRPGGRVGNPAPPYLPSCEAVAVFRKTGHDGGRGGGGGWWARRRGHFDEAGSSFEALGRRPTAA
jgi:hypothetical protein